MDEYMAASDLVVGKPGGLTTSEALARGLAFVIVNPIPGQEERNSDHLLEEGAAIRCNNLPVARLQDRPPARRPRAVRRHARHALRLARPRAAFDVAARLSESRRRPDRTGPLIRPPRAFGGGEDVRFLAIPLARSPDREIRRNAHRGRPSGSAICLGLFLRRVEVDPNPKAVSIRDRYLWLFTREQPASRSDS